MSKAIRKITSPLSKLGPIGDIITAVGLTAVGQPQLIPVVSGLKAYGQSGNILSGLAAGAGSYLGSRFGGNVFGDLGTVGGGLSSAAGAIDGLAGSGFAGNILNNLTGSLGGAAGNALGNIASTPISNILGGMAGNAIGAGLFGSEGQQEAQKPAGFVPSRNDIGEAPASLQGFGALNPEQQSSNLATQGVYGGGLAPQEQDYFLRLINRQLVDESGGVQDYGSQISPIESSYLQNLGLGGHNQSRDLLEAISKWKAA